jgi:cell division protein FtsL
MNKALSFALAALLVACALALVVSQYRSRVLFAELEVAQQESKSLDAEGARLRADLGRAAQPATVEALAHRLGLHPIEPQRIVLLPPSGPQAVHLATGPDIEAAKAQP